MARNNGQPVDESGIELRHFLVELCPTPTEWGGPAEVAAKARAGSLSVNRRGAPVALVRSVYAPESDSLFLVYRASTEDAVVEAARAADLCVISVSVGLPAAGGGGR